MSEDISLQPVARKLDDLDARMRSAVSTMGRRNTAGLVLALILALLTAGYLYYAYRQFQTVTPEWIADYSTGMAASYLDEQAPELQDQLKAQAPQVMDMLDQQVRTVPERFATDLIQRTEEAMDQHMPELEAEIEKSIRAGILQAQAEIQNMPGKTDEEKMAIMLQTIAQIYGDQTIKAVDEFRNKYKNTSTDIISHLDYLATNQNLDEEMKLQREIIVKFITLAEHFRNTSGQGDPVETNVLSRDAQIPGTK